MAGEMKNLAGLFVNTRTRIIVFFTLFLVFLGVVGAYFAFRGRVGPEATANVAEVPGSIRSIPGSFSPTEQYAQLQAEENILIADRALQRGTSAVPTIIRARKLEDEEATPEGAGAGFGALIGGQVGGANPKRLILDEISASGCNEENIGHARALGSSAEELRKAGCSLSQLKAAGFDAAALRSAGFSACDLKESGISARELLAAGYSPDELKGAGVSQSDIDAAAETIKGLPDGITAVELRNANCDVDVLKKARELGASATALRRITGCSAEAMRKAGFSARELAEAGYSVGELLKAGFSPAELRDAGIGLAELVDAGVTHADLTKAGFSDQEVSDAVGSLRELPSGFSNEDLKKAGCGKAALEAARRAGVSAERIKKVVGCSAEELLAAGFTPAELRRAGFSAGELRRAGLTPQQLKDIGFSAQELRDAGFPIADLRGAGFTAQQLKDAGVDVGQLRNAGFSAQQIKDAGVSPVDLKNAGFNANELREAGLNAQQLEDAGFTPVELQGAGFAPSILTTAPAATPASPTADDQGLQQIIAAQAEQFSQEQYQQQISQIKNNIQGQAQQLFTAWQSPSQTYVAGVPPTEQDGEGGGKSGRGDGADEGLIAAATVKAGDISFAVLNTSVNSDEPGPVMATIVSGKLSGARLLGSLSTSTRLAQKVVLSFNLMSLPHKTKSVSINAVAIDPKTARTALSSDTDNHYLQRFGLVFAAAFLQGLGEAITDSGATITQDADRRTTVTTATLSSGKKTLAAVGKIGEKAGEIFSQDVNRPPTIKVYSGVGLGVLFLSDVQIPAN